MSCLKRQMATQLLYHNNGLETLVKCLHNVINIKFLFKLNGAKYALMKSASLAKRFAVLSDSPKLVCKIYLIKI